MLSYRSSGHKLRRMLGVSYNNPKFRTLCPITLNNSLHKKVISSGMDKLFCRLSCLLGNYSPKGPYPLGDSCSRRSYERLEWTCLIWIGATIAHYRIESTADSDQTYTFDFQCLIPTGGFIKKTMGMVTNCLVSSGYGPLVSLWLPSSHT